MLVLEYGIECDLLADGNTKIVDGEIEITSEIFLRELEKKIELDIDQVVLVPYADLGGPAIMVSYTAWGTEDEFLCLDIATSDIENLTFHIREW